MLKQVCLGSLGVLAVVIAALLQYILSTELPDDLFYQFPDECQRHGYTCQRYDVDTKDGYTLALFRVLPLTGTPGAPLLLIHGVGVSGDQFVINYNAKPQAFLFVDSGYDVWVGNNRGTPYSSKHKTYAYDQEEYWDWTVEDIILKDMPALINKVKTVTKKGKVALFGHSQGAMVGLGLLSMIPEIQKDISVVIAVACPSGRNTNESFLFRLVMNPYAHQLFSWIGKFSFFQSPKEYFTAKLLIRFPAIGYYYTRSRYDPLRYGDAMDTYHYLFYRLPGGTSLKNLMFFQQAKKINKVCPYRFDYGPEKNLEVYGSEVPPLIQLSNVTTPIALLGGIYDLVVQPEDIQALYQELPKEHLVFSKLDYPHDHGSFALSSNQDFLQDVLKVLNDYACLEILKG